ncbi:conserved hypothetical protein [Trichinella spiralis]|uniref:hypothetical protein n=1 Tax=Trichinella spiralis TaxID=6334 RepID=UPI0001EFDB71|nr:conserved hypothetical protein [Trichinella spiralis]
MSEEIVEMVDLRQSWDLKWRVASCTNITHHSDCHWNMGPRNLCRIKQAKEALERKCICGDNRKTVSVQQVDLFVELARECEAWQKIIRRPVDRKQAQQERITNAMKIRLEFRHESHSNKLKVYENLHVLM